MNLIRSQVLHLHRRWCLKGTLVLAFLSALAVNASTCIVSGWPVEEATVSSEAVSATAITLGGASAFEFLGDVDLGRMTCDISEGIGIDARDFRPGLILVIR